MVNWPTYANEQRTTKNPCKGNHNPLRYPNSKQPIYVKLKSRGAVKRFRACVECHFLY